MPQTNHIGNRLQTKAGGDERGSAALRAAVYSANNLAALIALFGVGLTLSAPLDGGRVKNEHAIVLPYDPSVSGQFDPATDGPDRFCPQLAGFDLPDDNPSNLLFNGAEKSPRLDIAQMNLLCSARLPGAEGISLSEAASKLDNWASYVKSETERHLYRFDKQPEEFQNSEGYFRMLIMAVVLYQDFGVRYNTNRRNASSQAVTNDGFFADSQDVFLHGLLGNRRRGTCSSMPVLYVALGRRLGYPLKLVLAKGHVFARWESTDGRERFNIEATSKGLSCFSDDYYKQWPYPMSEQDLKSGHYLRSLTPQQELALFLQTRGHCLKAAGRLSEARAAYEQARRLAPQWPEHDLLIASVSQN